MCVKLCREVVPQIRFFNTHSLKIYLRFWNEYVIMDLPDKQASSEIQKTNGLKTLFIPRSVCAKPGLLGKLCVFFSCSSGVFPTTIFSMVHLCLSWLKMSLNCISRCRHGQNESSDFNNLIWLFCKLLLWWNSNPVNVWEDNHVPSMPCVPRSLQEIVRLIKTVEGRWRHIPLHRIQCLQNSQQGILENKLVQFLFSLIFCRNTS